MARSDATIGSRGWPLFVAVAVLLPGGAEAHTATQGTGSFWAGVAHCLTSLDQPCFLIGLAIWASFHDPQGDACMLASVFVAAIAGAFGSSVLLNDADMTLPALIGAMMSVVGIGAAAKLWIGTGALMGLAIAGGVLCGAGAAEGIGGLSLPLVSLGAAVAGTAVLSYGLIGARRIPGEWGIIVRRAGASWIGAIGLMILAFSVARRFGRA